jgi:hypothetical protein
MRTRNKWLIALVVLVATLIMLRLALPSLVTSYANRTLAAMDGYAGHVEDVDVSLLRGAYVLRGVRIVKPDSNARTPFFQTERVDISVQWQALLHGELVGEMSLHEPVLNLVQGEREDESQLGTGVSWPAKVREFFPFTFNRVSVIDGLVTFRAPGIDVDQSLTLRDMQMTVLDLGNVEEENREAFAELTLAGNVMGNAPITVLGRIDPNSDAPTFDIDFTLRHARLVDVNPWLRQFLNVDAEKGAFSMYAELAASDGAFRGYVKPILADPDLFAIDEPSQGVFQKAWEALVDLAAKIFENRQQEQVATAIPLSGKLEDPDADVLATIVNLLRNAFVGAFTHSIEGTVSLRDQEQTASAGH